MTPLRPSPHALSRRERQIMDVVYRLGRVTAADVHRELPDPPTYTTVRGLLRILIEKRHLRHERDGRRYVYVASTPRPEAGASSLAHVVRTFFGDSPADALSALLGSQQKRISEREYERLATIVERARGKRGRRK